MNNIRNRLCIYQLSTFHIFNLSWILLNNNNNTDNNSSKVIKKNSWSQKTYFLRQSCLCISKRLCDALANLLRSISMLDAPHHGLTNLLSLWDQLPDHGLQPASLSVEEHGRDCSIRGKLPPEIETSHFSLPQQIASWDVRLWVDILRHGVVLSLFSRYIVRYMNLHQV